MIWHNNIIHGIVDEEVNKIILYSAKSIFEFKCKFDIYEAMKVNISTLI